MVSAVQLPPDGPELDALVTALADRLGENKKKMVSPASAGSAGELAPYFSIKTLRKRWDVSRTTVYKALSEMRTAGYLKQVWFGNRPRIALESVLRYEAEHGRPAVACARSAVVKLRVENERSSPRSPQPRPPGKALTAKERIVMYRQAMAA